MSAVNSFGAKDSLQVGDKSYEIFRIDTVPGHEKLPFSLKVLLENLLRTEDGAILAVLTNRGPNPVHDVRLLIDYVYHWPTEQAPGDVSPGKSWPHVFGGTIAPGASETVRFVPSGGLPTAPAGTFEPKVQVLGFKETKSLAP